jgi:NAD+ synthetase
MKNFMRGNFTEQMINFHQTAFNIRQELKNYIIQNNMKSLILGVSGGIDSALVAALAYPVCKELNIDLIGRSITIESNKPDEIERAKNIGLNFCTKFKEVDFTEQFNVLKSFDEESEINTAYKIRMGNIKARMRMIYLMNLSSKYGGLVLGTENLCEHYLGFFTIGGDEVSGFEPIRSLWKHEVYDLAEYLALDMEQYGGEIEKKDALIKCIECDATDGLGISNTDLDQILPDWRERHASTRSGYKEVDNIFINSIFINNIYKIDKTLHESPVIKRYYNTFFKRRGAYIVERKYII